MFNLGVGQAPTSWITLKDRRVNTLLRFIIIFVVLFIALFDFLIICGPSIRKMLDEHKKKKEKIKRRKAFAKKMKDLEIK